MWINYWVRGDRRSERAHSNASQYNWGLHGAEVHPKTQTYTWCLCLPRVQEWWTMSTQDPFWTLTYLQIIVSFNFVSCEGSLSVSFHWTFATPSNWIKHKRYLIEFQVDVFALSRTVTVGPWLSLSTFELHSHLLSAHKKRRTERPLCFLAVAAQLWHLWDT